MKRHTPAEVGFDRFDLDVTLQGSFNAEYSEVTRIVLDGKEYDAREFPRGFVKSIQGRLS